MLTIYIYDRMDKWNFTGNERIANTELRRAHDGASPEMGRTKRLLEHMNLTSPQVFYIKCQQPTFCNGQCPNSP